MPKSFLLQSRRSPDQEWKGSTDKLEECSSEVTSSTERFVDRENALDEDVCENIETLSKEPITFNARNDSSIPAAKYRTTDFKSPVFSAFRNLAFPCQSRGFPYHPIAPLLNPSTMFPYFGAAFLPLTHPSVAPAFSLTTDCPSSESVMGTPDYWRNIPAKNPDGYNWFHHSLELSKLAFCDQVARSTSGNPAGSSEKGALFPRTKYDKNIVQTQSGPSRHDKTDINEAPIRSNYPAPSMPMLSTNSMSLHLGTPNNVFPGQVGHRRFIAYDQHSSLVRGVPGRRSDPNKPPPLKKYKCDVCAKAFSRSNTLVTHKRIHTGEKPFNCEVCDRAFRQPGNLTRHRLTHTTVKPYVCVHCNKAFNRASNLNTHIRTHTNFKPFVCQFCGKGFHQKIDMKIHSYTHTGEKPHKCKICGRGFKQLTHLTYHMRTHSNNKWYTCHICGKGFNQKGNLQSHIFGHTGERPHRCDVCGKGFTLSSTLNTHRRTHAATKPFSCQYCGKDFYQKATLKSHVHASHPLYVKEEFVP